MDMVEERLSDHRPEVGCNTPATPGLAVVTPDSPLGS
jgi:hypothetical protein